MAKKDFTTPLSLNGQYPNLDDRYTNNGDPYVSKNAAETALASKLNAYHIGLTVLVKESGWTEAKEYWVQPYDNNGVTAYHLVEKQPQIDTSGFATKTEVNAKQDALPSGNTGQMLKKTASGVEWDDMPSIEDGENTAVTLDGTIHVSAIDAENDETAGVEITPHTGGGVDMKFTLPKGDTGNDGSDGHNPCLGRFTAVPSTFAETPRAGDYYYVDTVDNTTTPPTVTETKIYKYDGTQWDSGTVVNVSNLTFATSEEVTNVAIDGTGLANPLPNALAKAEDVKSGLEQKVGVIACKNLCGSKIEGYRMKSNGNLEEHSSYNTYDYISVTANTDYVISMNGTKPSGGYIVAFYDSSKTFISALYEANSPYTVVGDFCYKTFNTPENTAFIRFIERKTNTNVQLELGTFPTYYIDPNQASTYADTLYKYMDTNKKEMVEKVSVKIGKNIYTGLNEDTGKFITSGGGVSFNSSYSVSDYIPVTAGHTYYVSANNNAAVSSSSSMYGAWYDETFTLISTTSGSMINKSFTAPENAVYFRFTHLNSRTKIMVEDVTGVENPTRSEYEPYSEISGYYPVLREGQVTYGKLAGEVQELLGNTKFGSFISSGEIAAGVTNRISNTTQSVRKYILYSALFEGAIDSDGVVFGVGSTDSSYHGYILTITDTDIILHRLDSSGSGTPHAHGLTLTNRTTVSIETMLVSTEELNTGASVDSPISKTIVKVSNDLGDSFTYEYGNASWGYGQLFVGNNTANTVQYRIDFFCKDIEKPIWIFADSYGEFDYRNRFPYFLWKEGYTNHLLNAHGGADGTDALTDLNNLLSLGKKPSFIVWLMGQNGNSDTQVDGEWVIASTQRTNIDNFLALCDANDITPILCTVPSVTAPRYHHGLCEYVRNSGRRYIDWEKAVGCNPDTGAWNTGLLSSDNVHPTGAGSYVLMRQMVIDFPEIAVL